MTTNVIGLVDVLNVTCDYCQETTEGTAENLAWWGWVCDTCEDTTRCPDCTDTVRAECECGQTATGPASELVLAGWSHEGLDMCPECMACISHSWTLTSDPNVLTCDTCEVTRRYRPLGETHIEKSNDVRTTE